MTSPSLDAMIASIRACRVLTVTPVFTAETLSLKLTEADPPEFVAVAVTVAA